MLKNIIGLKITFVCLSCNAQVLKRPIPDKLVMLSFDDAPASHYSIVAHLLIKSILAELCLSVGFLNERELKAYAKIWMIDKIVITLEKTNNIA